MDEAERKDFLNWNPGIPVPEGWHYRDVNQTLACYWQALLEAIEPENIKLITHAIYDRKDGQYERGQFLISDAGIANITERKEQILERGEALKVKHAAARAARAGGGE